MGLSVRFCMIYVAHFAGWEWDPHNLHDLQQQHMFPGLDISVLLYRDLAQLSFSPAGEELLYDRFSTVDRLLLV